MSRTARSLARAASLLLALVLAAPAAGKEIYLTVRRDFGPSESPEVEVHYARSSPFEVRVYRPKDLREFVTSQVDLRRAWRQPRVERNAARSLFLGLNRTRLELDWLRVAASAALRKSLAHELGGAEWTPRRTALSEGPTKLILGPERFELVSESAFYPDDTDAAKPFDVPGFDWWFGSSGRLRATTLRLPKLGPGFFLVQLVQGDLEGQAVVVVNDLSALVQQSDGAALVRVARRDGRPAVGAEVAVRNLQGDWVGSGRTDVDGVLSLGGVKETELLALVQDGEHVAIVDTEFFPTTARYPDVYIYSDRPMYRPGGTVRFKGILREGVDGLSRLWSSLTGKVETARVTLADLAGAPVTTEVEARLSRFGTFDGKLDLGSGDLNGVYRITAQVAGGTHVGEVRVKQYVRPLFFLKLKTEQETLVAGGSLDATVRAERYAGGIPKGLVLTAQLYRVRAQTPQWVEDAGLGETGSPTTYGWDRPATVGEVAVPYLVASQEEVEMGAGGTAELSLQLPPELPGPPNYDYSFVLKLFAKDPDGSSAQLSTTFADRRSEVVALLRLSSVYAAPDAPATLSLRAVTPSGKPYGKTTGSLTLTLTPYRGTPVSREVPVTTDDAGRFRMPVPTEAAGRLAVVARLVDRGGRPTTTEGTIVVAGKTAGAPLAEVPEMTLLPERESYAPGETARALVLLPDGWGEGGSDHGRLHLTVAGRRIHEQRVQEVKGLSAWIRQPISSSSGTALYVVVAYQDTTRGWVERTLTYRIPPASKALSVGVATQSPLVRPGQRQSVTVTVTDPSGRPVEAEVSISVVDRAVLALQPEFRPSLLSFFYPVDRLNLMSFKSRELQAYGYGESLAGRFTAGPWMAASKPKKPREDDTAYWNPRVVTDAAGRATVGFRLPGNQTTWHVSAVAADTRGRFGEGGTDFGTNSPITVAVGAPPFLRKGDRAEVRLLLASQQAKAQAVTASLATPAGLTLDRPLALSTRLAPNGEARAQATVTLTAPSPAGTASLAATLETSSGPLRFTREVRTLPDTTTLTERRVLAPGAEMSIARPDEVVKDVRITLTSRLAGALVPALRSLLAYPFGCAEQIASTTVPSLLVRDLLGARESGPSPRSGDRPLAAFLSRSEGAASSDDPLQAASDYAQVGLSRLKALQNLDGSLVWWPGQGKGDPTMTALVLSLLAALDDPEPLKLLDGARALGWAKGAVGPEAPTGAVLAYVEARLAALGLTPAAGSTQQAVLKFQAEKALSGTVLDQALVLLALAGQGLEKEPGFARLREQLLASVSAAVKAELSGAETRDPKAWTPLLGAWPRYPGRLPSTLAVAAHALAEHGRLGVEARESLTRRLLKEFDGSGFGSTFETSTVLVHSAWLLREELKASGPPPRVRLWSGGREVPSAKVASRPLPGGAELRIAPADAGAGPLRLEAPAELSARLVVTKEVPLAKVESAAAGWEVRKELFRLDAKSGAMTPLPGSVKVGDLVYVKLSFRPGKERPWWSSSYYAVSDQVPAGFTVVDEDKAYDARPFQLSLHAGWSRRDLREDEVRWFFAFERGWMDRAFQTGYVLRAQYAGEFSGAVARIEDFYDETLVSRTVSGRVTVEPLPERGGR